ncbi:MAG: flagellin [Pseudomonadota bacterium]
MANVVNTNTMSINAQRHLYKTDNMMKTAMERLSSGYRVNSAKDDAAGLAIATGMDSQVRGMTVAIRNANDGISMAQTAEGAIGELQNTLQRMRELAVQSSSGQYNSGDREKLQTEFKQLNDELTRVMTSTQFNGLAILNGSAADISIQVGANTTSDNRINIAISDLTTASGMASVATASIGSNAAAAGARGAIDAIDNALTKLSNVRGTLGAVQNRFTATITNLQSAVENQSAAKSRIMDADFAAETSALSKAQVLQQSGVAMLAQANQAPQAVLSLLR